MSSETYVPELEGAVGEGIIGEGEGTGPTLRPPDFNPCYSYVESVNPLFAPFSSMRIAPNTYLLATTQPATINPSLM
jgi:hypothetical protein